MQAHIDRLEFELSKMQRKGGSDRELLNLQEQLEERDFELDRARSENMRLKHELDRANSEVEKLHHRAEL